MISRQIRQISTLFALYFKANNKFEGKLTNKKYAALTKVSRDTALRDLTDLIEKGVLVRNESGGRSVSYDLAEIVKN